MLLPGEYTSAVSGTETSPYAENKIHYQESVASLLDFIAKYEAQDRTVGVSTITYDIDIDKTTAWISLMMLLLKLGVQLVLEHLMMSAQLDADLAAPAR